MGVGGGVGCGKIILILYMPEIRPSFLPDSIKVGPLSEDGYGEGYFTQVGNLENLPEDINRNIPDGFVLKEYASLLTQNTRPSLRGFYTSDGLMMGAGVFTLRAGGEKRKFLLGLRTAIEKFEKTNGHLPSEQEIKEVIFEDESFRIFQDKFGGRAGCKDLYYKTYIRAVAQELEKRNLVMKNYFAKLLPELVVPTHVFIDQDKKTKEKRLYEIQPRIKHVDYNNAEDLDEFVDNIKIMFPEMVFVFKKELAIFIKEIRKIPSETGHIPYDCPALGNLLFTKNGLRLIDTNAVFPVSEEPSEEEKNDVETAMRTFVANLKKLEIIESKL